MRRLNLICLGTTFWLVLAASSTRAQYDLETQESPNPIHNSGDGFQEVISADLTGDGYPEIIGFINEWSPLFWFENDGSGTFTLPTLPAHAEIPLDNSANLYHVHAADLDADGWTDLVVSGDQMLVFKNLSGGLFAPAEVYESALEMQSLVIADVTGDGAPDLLTAYNNQVYLHLNDGAGNFESPASCSPAYDSMSGFDVFDCNGDGDLDLVTSTEAGLSIHHNAGVGTFLSPQIADADVEPLHLFDCADLNNDGLLDLVAVGEETTYWFTQNSDNNYSSNTVFNSSQDANSLELADMNADGYLDVIVGSPDPKLVYYRNQSGQFYNNYNTIAEGVYPRFVSLADFNNDGSTDVLVTGTSAFDFVAFTQAEVDAFDQQTLSKSVSGWWPSPGSAAVVDVNGDGHLDLLMDAEGSDDDGLFDLEWLEGNSSGVFAPVHPIGNMASVPGDEYQAHRIWIHDLDDDGDQDAVVADNNGFHILGNVGGDYVIIGTFSGGLNCGHDLTFADIDGDGDTDICAHRNCNSWGTTEAYYFRQITPNYFQVIDTGVDQIDNWWFDLNGDGRQELLTLSPDGFIAYSTLEDDGSYSATPTLFSPLLSGLDNLRATDRNNDGLLDMVAFHPVAGHHILAEFINPGATGGTWTQTVIDVLDDSEYNRRAFEFADLDQDGIEDIVLTVGWGTFTASNAVQWYRGTPDFFHPRAHIETVFDVDDWFQVMDFTADGILDIVFTKDESLRVYPGVLAELAGGGCTDPEACNYNPEVTFDDGSCCTVCGCTIAAANNYDPLASCNDGSCLFTSGCTDALASNYNVDALLDDGSCTYVFSGVVWDDLFPDGLQQEDEIGLAFRTIHIPTADMTLITDDSGYFEVELQGLNHSFVPVTDAVFPYITQNNADPTTAATLLYEGIQIGLSKDVPLYEVCIDFYPSGTGGLCNAYKNFNICFRNMSNVPIDGVIAVEYDPLYQGYSAVTPIDSVAGNVLYLSFEDLPAGQMYFYDVELLIPTADFLGEWLTSQVNIWGYDELGSLVASGEQTLTEEVTCAYDPNDKQAFPLGYGDDHRLLDGTEQEFLVRFQNTGNAPAQTVVIRDTLDAHFDLGTFQLVANSHSVQTVLDATTREVVFTFADIQLPDSTCCEQDSHGLVSYRIKPTSGLAPETRLENTAYIYFDNNDPIVTNTTWTTIHACQQLLGFSSGLTEECPINAPYIQSDYIAYSGLEGDFYWTGDDGVLGLDPVLQLPAHFLGDIQLTVDNPLCTALASTTWTDSGTYWFTCPGDLDCDGVIGVPDLQQILVLFGCDGSSCPFELTGDGAITSEDMLLVLSTFGMACP